MAFRENLKKEPEAKEPRSIVGEAEPKTAIRRPVNSKTPCPPNDGPFISCSLRSVRAYTRESVHRRLIGSLDKFVPWLPKRDQPDRDETSTPPERSQSQRFISQSALKSN
jgi:hypothetical protein